MSSSKPIAKKLFIILIGSLSESSTLKVLNK
jgi:hypothetical protein